MSLYEILNVVTCLTSTITMIIVAVAILPHFKSGLAIVRDAVLWASLVVLLALMGWLGVRQLISYRNASPSKTADVTSRRSLNEAETGPSTENRGGDTLPVSSER